MKSRLSDPKVWLAIKNLTLAARFTVEAMLAGVHNSLSKGAGIEFSQYRSYQPGDDIRRLDWKLFARSDRYYIRESESEKNLSVRLLTDASASMNHEDNGFAKIEYARYLAASLAYLALQQGDAVGLSVFEGNSLHSLQPRNDHQHFARLCSQLENVMPQGSFSPAAYYKSTLAKGKRELLIFITDYHQQADEIDIFLRNLSQGRNDIIVFHVLGENEAELQFEGYSVLEDMETKQVIKIDSGNARHLYKQRLSDHITRIRSLLRQRGIWYQLITMNEPLDSALQQFLQTRKKFTR